MTMFFPVLWQGAKKFRSALAELRCPREVPWELIEPHRRQAELNHGGQTLEVLARRGGLSPAELMAVLMDRRWNDRIIRTDIEAVPLLRALLDIS